MHFLAYVMLWVQLKLKNIFICSFHTYQLKVYYIITSMFCF